MFDHLQIYESRERALVGLADVALAPLGWWPRPASSTPQRILLLRLERIGDLLMVLDAIASLRAAWPDATIDLAVGSWNAPIAALMAGVDRVEVMDVPWLAREGTGLSMSALWARAGDWRARRYDLTINFEPDIRSNLLAWRGGSRRRVGYWTGGGGALLTDALAYDPTRHVSANALALIDHVIGRPVSPLHSAAVLHLPPEAIAAADALLSPARRRRIGVHVSGGRESKQWHLSRFAEVAHTLGNDPDTTIVLTGSAADRNLVSTVRDACAVPSVIDTAGRLDLPGTAALLSRLDLLITGDTGPMHLASAVGTPVVALFGPSDPRRYGPLATRQRVVRVQLPCSPCGQVRLPPERCRGHVPDCMDGIAVTAVVDAARDLLAAASREEA